MILVTCLNPALDVTYDVAQVTLGHSHRVRAVTVRAGGKGTNVARVLSQLGVPAVLLAGVGGTTGEEFAADLGSAGLRYASTCVGGETRRTVTVTSPTSTTVFNEPGSTVTAAEWGVIRERFGDLASEADVVVLTGSLPPGIPDDAYAQLTSVALGSGAKVLLDADGAALTQALPAAPTLVKVNVDEAQGALDAAGRQRTNVDGRLWEQTVFDAPAALIDLGAQAAVVTHGADGLAGIFDSRRLLARLTHPVTGNPTGAGDALSAVLAAGMASRSDWAVSVSRAVVISGAAVAVPHAGAYDADLERHLTDTAVVTEL